MISSASPHVTRDDDGGVATITLRSPALSGQSRAELTDAFRDVAADSSVRTVVLTGSGRAFCVGQDLTEHVTALRSDPARALDVVADSGPRGGPRQHPWLIPYLSSTLPNGR